MTKLLTPAQTVFESVTCPRCGGSGSYSFNMVDGSRCYGCSGQGVKLTKRGAAAKRHLIELQTKPVSELKPGDFIWYETMSLDGRSFSARWRKVESIEQSGTYQENADGTKTYFVDIKTAVGSVGEYPDGRVRSIRDEEERKATVVAALAYQATLTKMGKPSKR